tara:strand:- start:84 stop:248 length:165 start_codon:yes stop_codon:yes gene_type:complete
MKRDEAIKFIERHIPILTKNTKGRIQFPYVSIHAKRQVIESLAEALVKSNIVIT